MLDPWFIRNVILYPHEEDGSLTPREDSQPTPSAIVEMSPFERFRFGLRKRGFPDERIEEMWERRKVGP